MRELARTPRPGWAPALPCAVEALHAGLVRVVPTLPPHAGRVPMVPALPLHAGQVQVVPTSPCWASASGACPTCALWKLSMLGWCEWWMDEEVGR